MAVLTKTIVIKAPVEKIFAYLNDPLNLVEYWTGMEDVKDVQPLPNGGTKFKWYSRFMGFRLDGLSEDIDIVPNRKLVSKTTGGVDMTITWDIETIGGETRISLEETYDHVPVLGKLGEGLLVKMNEQGVETILANLKIRMET
jgi:carbon monoxide dehydrogenase subunit G